MDTVIQYKNVSKCFTLSHDRPRSLQEMMINWLSWKRKREPGEQFWALKDVSFEIKRGRTVGLVGSNGSGKSTALKLMAMILRPSSGEVIVNGRISALLELGAGMHPDLTGRENIFLNGTMLGLTNAEIEALYPEIVRFSELERFIDMPVKHYSSGMYMRLGFSVAIHVQPDILLLDEVLAVGDQAFQKKCTERIYAMKKAGTTIVLVSHSLEAVQELCDDLIWLKKGKLMSYGQSTDVAEAYLNHIYELAERGDGRYSSDAVSSDQRWGNREVEITDVRLRRGQAEYTDQFRAGDQMTVEMDYYAHHRVEEPLFGLAIHHVDGTHICGPNNKIAGVPTGVVEGAGTIIFTVPDLPLLSGSYDLTVAAYDQYETEAYDVHSRAYTFHVSPGGARDMYGLFRFEGEWNHLPATTLSREEINSSSPA